MQDSVQAGDPHGGPVHLPGLRRIKDPNLPAVLCFLPRNKKFHNCLA